VQGQADFRTPDPAAAGLRDTHSDFITAVVVAPCLSAIRFLELGEPPQDYTPKPRSGD